LKKIFLQPDKRKDPVWEETVKRWVYKGFAKNTIPVFPISAARMTIFQKSQVRLLVPELVVYPVKKLSYEVLVA
jgi:hypothetical protein